MVRLLIIVLFFSVCQIVHSVKNYEVVLHRTLLEYVNKEYADANVTVNKINKTSYGITAFIEIYKNIPLDTEIFLQCYVLYSNEYRRAPLTIKRTLCDLFDMEYQFVIGDMRKVGNFPEKCPLKKGMYAIKNYVPDGEKFPSYIPWNDIMIDAKVKSKALLLIHVKVYFHLDHDVALKG